MNSKRFIIGRWVAAVLALGGFSFAIYQVVVDNMPKGYVRVVNEYTPWSDEFIETAATLPVQDGGRVKPLSTFAGFTMLQLHGARSMKISDGKGGKYKIGPTEWMLDCLFRPELAREMPTFRVDNADALEAIGVDPRSRRDRYSYSDIGEDKRGALFEKYLKYREIESKHRDPLQKQLVDLANNVLIFESLLNHLSHARQGIWIANPNAEGGFVVHPVSDVMTEIPGYMPEEKFIEFDMARKRGASIQNMSQLDRLFFQVHRHVQYGSYSLFPFPPAKLGEDKWDSAGDLIKGVMTGKIANPELAIEDITKLETLTAAASDQQAFEASFGEFAKRIKDRSQGLESVFRVEMEYDYYQANWFLNALVLFLLGSVFALAMWTLGKGTVGTVSYWLTAGFTAAGVVCCVTAIVIRCLIMQRPPIGNLYDTIIFIGATITIISLIVEWMTRRRFALGIGPILGTALVLLARRYEVGDAGDHMDPLVAVLDSNYWLTTHVITITLGYSAGLLSAFLSGVYVLMRGLGLDEHNKELRRPLTRAVYGMICFTLLLSLVGTVLGGIWANDSWGRFWGWDPKENGALMIVLWALVILHARLGGYIKEWGLHVASMFTAVVVTFSWWHVNFLGVGLHNYGFTAGENAIWIFYATIGVLMAFAIVVAVVENALKKKPEKGEILDHSPVEDGGA